MKRRNFVQALGTLPLWAATGAWAGKKATTMNETTANRTDRDRMPMIFAAHGAPVLLDDEVWMRELAEWAAAMPRPRSILMISAHWEEWPVMIGATTTVPLVYDFSGFPERFYRTEYPAPGAPELATRVRGLLQQAGLKTIDDPTRGLDHGAYVPLVAMYPEADVPVLQISIPGLDPELLYRLGRYLAPLRNEGVLIFGSGFLTHNMRYAFRRGVPGWAHEFDEWAARALGEMDIDALVDFQHKAPAVNLALPTWEHYAPVLVAAGAAYDQGATASFPITGWWMDSPFTKRSVQFG